jgi:four helix bundle protein
MKDKTKILMKEVEEFERISPIKSFKDLEVYQVSYRAMLIVFNEILEALPKSEVFDLKSQVGRSSKAIPRLLAEGFAKRHQKKGFQKYLFDAIAESNETEVSITQCLDLYTYRVDQELCKWLINVYDRISKQTYVLKKNWENYNNTDNV